MTPATPRYPGRAPIDAYGNGGFRFAGMSHRGSILCLPDGIVAWQPLALADVDLATLAPAVAALGGGAHAILLLGTGSRQEFPPRSLREALSASGIGLECMATGAAARTYNVLLAEERRVGAALIAVE